MESDQQCEVELERLRALYDQSPLHKAFFNWLSSRERPRHETNLDRIVAMLRARGFEADRWEVTSLLRELEATGCGDFVSGRGGRQSRFLWSHNLIAVGKAASGLEDQPEPLPLPKVIQRRNGRRSAVELDHFFNLRPDVRLHLKLPQDLSVDEAERLAAFVRTLPFRA